MRIGIDASFLRKPMTGIGQVTVHFLQELVRFQTTQLNAQKQPFSVILYCQEEPLLDFALPQGFEIRVFLPWWQRDDVLRQWWWERQVSREAVWDGCDVFLSLYQSATSFKSCSKPLRHVMLIHDLIPRLFPEYHRKWSQRLHYRAVQQALLKANQLVVPSRATAHDLEQVLTIPKERISIIPLGVDSVFGQRLSPDTLQAILAQYGIDGLGYLYHGGGLEVRKNTELVLRAYATLVKEKDTFPMLPPLVISGKIHAATNPLATPVRKLIQELELSDRVKLVGEVSQAHLPAFYQGASVFLFPSRYEGFGLPVLEALAAETPVITTSAGALAELVTGDEALIISLSGAEEIDAAVLSQTIWQVLTDAALVKTLASRGKERAAKYTWDAFTATLFQILIPIKML